MTDAPTTHGLTAMEAIRRSAIHDETVHIPHSTAAGIILWAECDGWAEGEDELEFWGVTDDDGYEWRVHMARG